MFPEVSGYAVGCVVISEHREIMKLSRERLVEVRTMGRDGGRMGRAMAADWCFGGGGYCAPKCLGLWVLLTYLFLRSLLIYLPSVMCVDDYGIVSGAIAYMRRLHW